MAHFHWRTCLILPVSKIHVSVNISLHPSLSSALIPLCLSSLRNLLPHPHTSPFVSSKPIVNGALTPERTGPKGSPSCKILNCAFPVPLKNCRVWQASGRARGKCCFWACSSSQVCWVGHGVVYAFPLRAGPVPWAYTRWQPKGSLFLKPLSCACQALRILSIRVSTFYLKPRLKCKYVTCGEEDTYYPLFTIWHKLFQ